MAHPIRLRLNEIAAASARPEQLTPAGTTSRRAALRAWSSATALIVGAVTPAGFACAQSIEPASLPQGGHVISGSATIAASGNAITIAQSSPSSVIDWNSFSVAGGNSVVFSQPTTDSVTLNLVTGNTPSTLAGSLTATGTVVLLNPNGVAITPTGTINVGAGFVASTLALEGTDAQGKMHFKGDGHSTEVSNAGHIVVGARGFAALVGGSVSNSGTITVPMGHITLGAGEAATIDTYGDGFMQVALANMPALGRDSLRQLNGGFAKQAWRHVVYMPGHVAANSASVNGASIVLSDVALAVQEGVAPSNAAAGTVNVSGTLDVSSASERGGTVSIAGHNVRVAGSRLDASGTTGGTIAIGGGAKGSPIVGMAAASSTSIGADTVLNASGSEGNGGVVTLWGGDKIDYAGHIVATGHRGDGGSAEVSGNGVYNYAGTANLLSAGGTVGTLTLDPGTIVICHAGDAGCSGAVSVAAVQADASTTDTAYLQDTTLASALGSAAVSLSASIQIKDSSSGVAVTTSSGGALTLTAPGIKLIGSYGVKGGLAFSNTDVASLVSGVVSGTGAVTKTGSGTLTLTGINTYSADTTINSGTLAIGNGGSGRVGTGNISIATGATLFFNTNGYQSGTLINGNISGGGTVEVGGSAQATYTVRFNGDNSGLTGIFQVDAGARASIYAGTSGSATADFVVNGLLTPLASNQTYSLGSLSGSGKISNGGGSTGATLLIGVNNKSTTFSGNIGNVADGSTIRKQGLGTLTLSGTATYARPTYVDSGTLTLTGVLGASGRALHVTVASNSTFDGNGTVIGNSLTLDGTGTVSLTGPNKVSNLSGTIGNLVYNNADALTINPLSANGQIQITSTAGGDITLAATINTASSAPNAIVIAAGDDISSGTSTGGNVIVAGGDLAFVQGGGAQVFTGSVADSTGLSAIGGVGAYRYGSNRLTTNYTRALSSGTSVIYREQPVLSLAIETGGASKFYDGTTTTAIAMIASGLVNGDSPNITGTIGSARNAGTYNFSTATLVNDLGYAMPTVNANYTINRAVLTLLGTNSTNTYNASAQTNAAATLVGLQGTDSYSITGSYAVGTDVGNYPDSLGLVANSGTLASNYDVSVFNGSLAIAPAALTLSGANTGVTYDGTAHGNGAAALVGLQGLDSFTITGVASGIQAGSYSDALGLVANGGTLAGNYTLGITNGALSIGQAALTITGASTAATYNGAAQSNTYAITAGQLYGADTLTGVAGLAHGTNAGTYADTLAGASGTGLANYAITYQSGSLAIAPAALTLSGANTGVTYDGTAHGNGAAALVGLQGLDSFTITGVASGIQAGSYSDALGLVANGGTLAGNYTLGITNGALSIAQAALTITGATTAATYNGAAQSNTYAITAGRLYGADTLTGVAGLAHGTNAGTYADTLAGTSGTGLANYAITYQSGSLAIAPAALTLSGANTGVTYDGTAHGNGAAALVGLQGLDSFTITGVASGIQAGSYSDALGLVANGGTLAGNYTLGITNGALSIGQAALTITGASTAATYNGAAQSNTYAITAGRLYGADTLTGVAGLAHGTNAGTYADTLAGTSGTGLANYAITYQSGSLAIAPAALTLSGANTGVTYDGTAHGNGAAALVGLQGLDSFTITGVASGIQAGSYSDALGLVANGGTLAGNYTLGITNGALSIAQAALTITGASTAATYNGAAQSNTYAITAGQLYGADTLTGVAGLAHGTNAGTYADTLAGTSGTGLANYAITYQSGSLAIAPAALTLSGANTGVTYDGTAHGNGAAALVGLQGLDSFTITGVASGIQAGSYSDALGLVATGGTLAGNYTLGITNGALSIAQAALTITGASTAATYNGAAQSNTYAITAGRLYGADTLTGVAGLARGTNAGTYADTLAGASGTGLANYAITYQSGSLAIAPAALTLSGANTGVTYDGTAHGNGAAALVGLQGLDSFTITGVASGIQAGSYSDALGLVANGGTLAGNYTLGITNGALSIGQAALTITGATTAATYNGAAQSNTYAITAGRLYGADTLTGVAGLAHGTNAGTYADTLAGTSGTGLANYAITYQSGSLAIAPAALTLSGANTGVTYDGTAHGNGAAALVGLQGLDSFTITGVASGIQAGSYSDALGLVANGGTLAGNYTLGITNGALSIAQAALTITGASTAATYNGAAQSNTYAITAGQLYGADTLTGVAGLAHGTNAGTYADTLAGASGTGLANYAITYQSGSLAIAPAALTLSGANTGVTYDGTAHGNGAAALVGLQGLDSFTITGVASGIQAGSYSDALGLVANGGTLAGNYTLGITNGALSIAQAALTITGASTAATYNGAAQSNTYAITAGRLYGADTLTGVAGLAHGTNAGTYADTLAGTSGTGLANYAITYQSGSLAIAPAALTLSGANTGVTYDGTAHGNGAAALVGLQGLDSFTITGVASGIQAGSYSDALGLVATGGTLAGNYTLGITNGALSIAQAALTITGASTAATYNGAAQSNTYAITAGRLYGADTLTGVAGLARGTNAGTYADTLAGASGTGLANYAITYQNGGLAIAPAALTINLATDYAPQLLKTTRPLCIIETQTHGDRSRITRSSVSRTGPDVIAAAFPCRARGRSR